MLTILSFWICRASVCVKWKHAAGRGREGRSAAEFRVGRVSWQILCVVVFRRFRTATDFEFLRGRAVSFLGAFANFYRVNGIV